ncbi:DMT(drug/metabolite transporter) superfamily permease [Aequorivita sublithincola DSM 14238]|uniref:DMT(Drug/metabolite transporter) superfamily permease n=1 Tax=Aequorivita sublithincola (strain DSM 14238 / LMG 21431 / ACAM 643 / 9-3) TaxID=746697 RepID=I3YRK2_AEQSU|nr:DMT family transporter [Aequorivita sublithincola]AFL79620.1 DMT(drug/metabolite transporter) superfamily permease [Aequorivita sublithincola DSM 14238]
MGKSFDNKWILLIIIGLTWGSSFILIKKSLLVFSPYEIGAFRVAISGLILGYLGFPALRKMDKKTLFWVALTGFFGNFLPMYLFPIAQTRVSSSMAGILDSLVPVFVLILGFFLFGIKSKWLQVFGALIGFAGAAMLMYFSETTSEESKIGYALLVVLATACYAVAGLIIKEKLQHVPSVKLSGAVFSVWMIPSLIILVLSGFFSHFEANPQTWEALGYLSVLTVVGTAIAMILYYKLIQKTSAVFASTVTYLLPLVAVIWGLLDGEKFTIYYVIGGLLILWGIYLIREKKKA